MDPTDQLIARAMRVTQPLGPCRLGAAGSERADVAARAGEGRMQDRGRDLDVMRQDGERVGGPECGRVGHDVFGRDDAIVHDGGGPSQQRALRSDRVRQHAGAEDQCARHRMHGLEVDPPDRRIKHLRRCSPAGQHVGRRCAHGLVSQGLSDAADRRRPCGRDERCPDLLAVDHGGEHQRDAVGDG